MCRLKTDRSRNDATAVRPATPDDAADVTRIETLDGRRLGAGPILVAERDGEIVAALSLADGATVGDPFRFTLDAVTALRRAAAERGAGDSSAARPRLHRRALGALGLAAIVSAGLIATAGQAAPKPGFAAGTWVGSGTITGSSTDGPMTVHFNGAIRFTLKIGSSRNATGSGTWRLDMLGSEDAYSDTALDSTLQGRAALTLGGTSTNVTFSGTQNVVGEIRSAGVSRPFSVSRPLRGRLAITRAGQCRVTGASTMPDGVALRWSAVLRGSDTCRT